MPRTVASGSASASASTSRSRRRRYRARIRRRWRSSSPRARKSANACCSIRAVPQSARSFSSVTASQQLRRHHKPAQPQRRRQRLAGRAGVDDPVGLESLEGADRRSVVAVLGVVVVLDHDRVVRAEPREQGRTPLAGEDGAGRVLVGGGEDDRVDVGPLERLDPDAAPRRPRPARPRGRPRPQCDAARGGWGSRTRCASHPGRRGPGRRCPGPASTRT